MFYDGAWDETWNIHGIFFHDCVLPGLVEAHGGGYVRLCSMGKWVIIRLGEYVGKGTYQKECEFAVQSIDCQYAFFIFIAVGVLSDSC